jgi:hypothetical protein
MYVADDIMSTKNYTHISFSSFFRPDSRFYVPHLWSAGNRQSLVIRGTQLPLRDERIGCWKRLQRNRSGVTPDPLADAARLRMRGLAATVHCRGWPGDMPSDSGAAGWLECCGEWGKIEGSRGVAQPGSASALGAEGRQFESDRPDHHNSLRIKQMWRLRPAHLLFSPTRL